MEFGVQNPFLEASAGVMPSAMPFIVSEEQWDAKQHPLCSKYHGLRLDTSLGGWNVCGSDEHAYDSYLQVIVEVPESTPRSSIYSFGPGMLTPNVAGRIRPPIAPSKLSQGSERSLRTERTPFKRTKAAPPPDTNKPLPLMPRRSSSVYSDDSRFAPGIHVGSEPRDRIPEVPPIPSHVRPLEYSRSMSNLLTEKLEQLQSTSPVPSLTSDRQSESSSVESSKEAPRKSREQKREESVPMASVRSSPISPLQQAGTPPATEQAIFSPVSPFQPQANSLSAPNSARSSPNPSQLRKKRSRPSTAPSPQMKAEVEKKPEPDHRQTGPAELEGSPVTTPGLSAVPARRQSPLLSPRITSVVDMGLVPAPLVVPRLREKQNKSPSRFSAITSDTNLSKTSVWRRIFRSGRSQRKRAREAARRKELDELLLASPGSPRHPISLSNGSQTTRKARRGSLSRGILHLYEKVRIFSSVTSTEQNVEPKTPQRRDRQRAIPLSPYQKYGPIVWENEKQQEKEMRKIRDELLRTKNPSNYARSEKLHKSRKSMELRKALDVRSSLPTELVTDFENGQKKILVALDEVSDKMKRSPSEKRRRAVKKSIRHVGPPALPTSQRVNYWI